MSQANDLTKAIIQYISDKGGYAFRVNTVGIYDVARGLHRTAPKKGISDVLALWEGQFVAVEVKIGKDRLSDEQDGFLKNIEHFGGVVIIARTFDQFKAEWINAIDNLYFL